MQPLTIEWITKAEGDYATACRELRARISPNYDASCFHSQQCAEKYLKALLQERAIPFGKTHNLTYLLDLAAPHHPELSLLQPTVAILSAYAVEYRYPGESADKQTAKKAVRLAEDVKHAVMRLL